MTCGKIDVSLNSYMDTFSVMVLTSVNIALLVFILS